MLIRSLMAVAKIRLSPSALFFFRNATLPAEEAEVHEPVETEKSLRAKLRKARAELARVSQQVEKLRQAVADAEVNKLFWMSKAERARREEVIGSNGPNINL